MALPNPEWGSMGVELVQGPAIKVHCHPRNSPGSCTSQLPQVGVALTDSQGMSHRDERWKYHCHAVKIPTPIEGEGGGGQNQPVEFHFFLLGTPGIVIQPLEWNCKVTFIPSSNFRWDVVTPGLYVIKKIHKLGAIEWGCWAPFFPNIALATKCPFVSTTLT